MGDSGKQYFINQVLGTIGKHGMIKPGDSVLVCVSGGADSVALLAVLAELREKLGIHNIYAFHLNHNLRASAKDDENFVRLMCCQMNIPLDVRDVSVGDFAKKNKIGIEEAGRIARRSHAALACESFCAEKIAMGHNMGDNAETVMLNLCRGAGLRGISGIPPVNGQIVRPLINSSRADILAYLNCKKQPYVVDPSNQANDYARNRIRNTVMPLLRSNVNSNAEALIANSTELFSADEQYLNEAAAACLLECVIQEGGEAALCTLRLGGLHFSIASRVIRMVLAGFGLADIGQAHIKALLELSAGQAGKKFVLADICATKEYGRVVLRKATQASKGFCYELELGKPKFIPEISKTISVSAQNFLKNPIPYCTELLKYGIIPKSVIIRSRLAGDRIRLSSKDGRNFTKKLQDFFTDAKIPASRRDEIPILTIDGKIAWLIYGAGKRDVGVVGSDFKDEKETAGIYVAVWEGNYAENSW